MHARTKLGIAVAAIALLSQSGALATPAVHVADAGPTITIENTGAEPPYTFSPAQLEAKVGQPITVTNNDPNGVHNVTAKDKSFSVDIPPKSSATLTVSKAGKYDYICQYHTDAHNPASLNVS